MGLAYIPYLHVEERKVPDAILVGHASIATRLMGPRYVPAVRVVTKENYNHTWVSVALVAG